MIDDKPFSFWPWFGRGAFDALSFPAWTVAFALVGVGSIARDVGQPLGSAVLSTLLVWAGPAQVIFYGGLGTGMAPLAIAAAVCFSSIRFLPMTMSILPLIRRPKDSLLWQMVLAHYVAVTVWSEGLRRLPNVPVEARQAYYLGFANACVWLAALGTGLGYFLVGALPGPLAAALLFLTPIFFTLSVSGGARRLADWLAIFLGFALQPLSVWLVGESFDLLAVGLVGGTVAFLVARLGDARAAARQGGGQPA
ncbi:AzlC family ABC transporter permease [uncultured Alsobacter sp.]|uniref:AzlC family ABC transporter permease n=1 Tax=uncultured Alsobacter sp. TaxID=1748258 RepID=UPI0025F56F36|nr:AzlC family ABC transporter permease [uncultured Alsobacter sp.]